MPFHRLAARSRPAAESGVPRERSCCLAGTFTQRQGNMFQGNMAVLTPVPHKMPLHPSLPGQGVPGSPGPQGLCQRHSRPLQQRRLLLGAGSQPYPSPYTVPISGLNPPPDFQAGFFPEGHSCFSHHLGHSQLTAHHWHTHIEYLRQFPSCVPSQPSYH